MRALLSMLLRSTILAFTAGGAVSCGTVGMKWIPEGETRWEGRVKIGLFG